MFLCFVFAIEAICSVSDKRIVEGLANFVSTIDMPSPAAKQMKSIYKIRSKIVHHGQTFVARNDIKLAQMLSQSAIYKAMHIYDKLVQKSGSLKRKDWSDAVQTGVT
nr:HEPN domain-containing protein [Pseudoalteromonas caenipelagi]